MGSEPHLTGHIGPVGSEPHFTTAREVKRAAGHLCTYPPGFYTCSPREQAPARSWGTGSPGRVNTGVLCWRVGLEQVHSLHTHLREGIQALTQT